MDEVQPSLEKQKVAAEVPLCCSECGWPGTGLLPAGVSLVSQKGKTVLAGKLSYFRINNALCSLCQEMQATLANRPWFVKAQAEYLDQINVKKEMSDS